LLASSINVLAASKIIFMLYPLAKCSRRGFGARRSQFSDHHSARQEDIRTSTDEHRSKAYRSESGMIVLAMSSNRLPMTGVLRSIKQKPSNELLIIVVLLTLNNDLKNNYHLRSVKNEP